MVHRGAPQKPLLALYDHTALADFAPSSEVYGAISMVQQLAVAVLLEGDSTYINHSRLVEDLYRRLTTGKALTDSARQAQGNLSVYVGLQRGQASDARAIENAVNKALGSRITHCHAQVLTGCDDNLAVAWEALGHRAFNEGAEYVLFLHTGHETPSSTSWSLDLVSEFRRQCWLRGLDTAITASTSSSPANTAVFGCLSLVADNTASTRFYPLLHKTHFEVMGNSIFPKHALSGSCMQPDRLLHYAYSSINLARISKSVSMHTGSTGRTKRPSSQFTKRWPAGALEDLASKLAGHVDDVEAVVADKAGRPPSLDVIVPTYRVDMKLLRGICNTRPANDGSVTYVIVDRPDVSITAASMQKALSDVKPAIVLFNKVNSGVTYSRNQGIKSSAADYLVFQDDDVVPTPGLLEAYTRAIMEHANDAEPPLAYIGMINFPKTYNCFTRALRLSGCTNAFEIADRPAWGCTANVCVRNTFGLKYNEDFPKLGGGEDADFFLRKVKGRIVSVPDAEVTHPWWTEGKRSYQHFLAWGRGDGRLPGLWPEYSYYSCPDVVETLVAVWSLGLLALTVAFISCGMGCTAGFMSPRDVMCSLILMTLALFEVNMWGDVLRDSLLLRVILSDDITGWRRVLGLMEGSLVLAAAEAGRLEYHLTKGSWRDICHRFDFYAGVLPKARRAWKITYAFKFAWFLVYGIAAQLMYMRLMRQPAWGGDHIATRVMIAAVTSAHASTLAFLMSLLVVP